MCFCWNQVRVSEEDATGSFRPWHDIVTRLCTKYLLSLVDTEQCFTFPLVTTLSPTDNIPSLLDNHETNTRSSFHSSFLELLLLDIRPLDGQFIPLHSLEIAFVLLLHLLKTAHF
jgi:hypothetical protein